MKVTLIAHTALSQDFYNSFDHLEDGGSVVLNPFDQEQYNERSAVALTAIRTCYSHLKPSEILSEEGEKYFGKVANDGKEGSEADRLIRQIINSKHTSTLEHINYTFTIESVSRSLLAQLTRHRHMSFSVQSQRYVRFGSEDKSEGFEFVTPPSIAGNETKTITDWFVGSNAFTLYETYMEKAQETYDALRKAGVPAEDARYILPNGATCNIVLTCNLRSLLEFYSKRKKGNGAQWEICDLADAMKDSVLKVDSWLKRFFEGEEK